MGGATGWCWWGSGAEKKATFQIDLSGDGVAGDQDGGHEEGEDGSALARRGCMLSVFQGPGLRVGIYCRYV